MMFSKIKKLHVSPRIFAHLSFIYHDLSDRSTNRGFLNRGRPQVIIYSWETNGEIGEPRKLWCSHNVIMFTPPNMNSEVPTKHVFRVFSCVLRRLEKQAGSTDQKLTKIASSLCQKCIRLSWFWKAGVGRCWMKSCDLIHNFPSNKICLDLLL